MIELPNGVRAFDEGSGPPVLVVPPGMDDGTGYAAVAAALAGGARVYRYNRRRYRLDLPPSCEVDDEVADIVALGEAMGGRPLCFGHSSGAVLALEAAVRRPDLWSALVLYEPPLAVDGHRFGDAMLPAVAAVAANRPGRAMRIFLRDAVGLPPFLAWLAALFVALHPRYRPMVERQIGDAVTVDALGVRLDRYASLPMPVVLLGGSTSPAHLGERLSALQAVIPRASRVTLEGEGHGAQTRAPERLAREILAALG